MKKKLGRNVLNYFFKFLSGRTNHLTKVQKYDVYELYGKNGFWKICLYLQKL